MGQLDNRTALITGGGTGIGLAVAKRFHAEGASVIICGRRAETVSEAAKTISPRGERVLSVPADICREEEVRNLVDRILSWKGGLDILVNNAGAMRINKAPEDTSLEEWQSVIDTNITGTFLCSREAGRVMIRQKRGWIVNVGSMSGTVVNRYFHGGSYEVSKCAMHMLTKVLAVEWAQHNITVNAIAPGYFDTKPNREFFAQEKDLYDKVIELIPLHSLGDVEQLSKLVLALVTDTASYMTGAVIPVNGGYTIY
jgi:NAD(P)-dependent dehydrogenase (short-subunit alcohol dehydrogenase family)